MWRWRLPGGGREEDDWRPGDPRPLFAGCRAAFLSATAITTCSSFVYHIHIWAHLCSARKSFELLRTYSHGAPSTGKLMPEVSGRC